MGIEVKNFVGIWNVQWVTGKSPWLSEGWKLAIGTGSAWGDSVPYLNEEYQTCLGFAVVDGADQVVLSSVQQDEYHQPLALLFADGCLRWAGWYDAKPVRLYISLSTAQTSVGEPTYALYGSTIYGDPDQVAVWGADGTGGRPGG